MHWKKQSFEGRSPHHTMVNAGKRHRPPVLHRSGSAPPVTFLNIRIPHLTILRLRISVFYMHIKLIIRNLDSCFIKAKLNLFHHIS